MKIFNKKRDRFAAVPSDLYDNQPFSQRRQLDHLTGCVAVAGIRQAAPDAVSADEHVRHDRDFLLGLQHLSALGAVASHRQAFVLAGCLHREILHRLVHMGRRRRGGCCSRR